MKPKLYALAAVALVAVVLALWLLIRAADREPATAALHSIDTGDARDTELSAAPSPPSFVSIERALAAEGEDEPPRTTASRGLLTGRCLDAQTELPLANCRVVVSRKVVRSADGSRIWGQPRSIELATGADGRFGFQLDPEREASLALEIYRESYELLSGMLELPAPERDLALGDLRLRRASPVRGFVLDEGGSPVEGAELCFGAEQGASIPGWVALRSEVRAVSGSDGRFALECAMPAGQRLRLREDSRQALVLLEPHVCEVAAEAADLLVRVRRLPAIRGRVIDERGKPIAHAGIAVARCAHQDGGEANASDRGTFALRAMCKQCASATLEVEAGFAEEAQFPNVAWDAANLELAVRRSLALDLDVVDRESGAKVAPVFVTCTIEVPDGRRLASSMQSFADAVHIEALPRGTLHVKVRPADHRYAPTAPQTIEISDAGPRRVRVLVDRNPALVLRVVDGERRPIAGSHAELLTTTQVVAHATSDERGLAELHGAELDRSYLLRIRSERHGQFRREDFAIDALPKRLECVLQRGATLRGRLGPASVLTLAPALLLEAPAMEHRIPVAADGGFALENAPEGTWAVRLLTHAGRSAEPFATIEIPPSGDIAMDIDAALCAPASLAGVVRCSGSAARAFELRLYHATGPSFAAAKTVAIDENGRFEVPALLPGRYALTARVALATSAFPRQVEVTDEVELAAGVHRELELELPLRSARYRFADAQGVPIEAGTRVVIATERRLVPTELVFADEQGAIALDPAPTGRFRFAVGGVRGLADRGWLELPDGSEPVEQTLVVNR